MWNKVDHKKLATMMTPHSLRKEAFLNFMFILVEELQQMSDRFNAKRKRDLYILNHNWQVFSIRAVLNDHFDRQQRRIQIVSGDEYNREYIYTHAEQRPVYLGTLYLRLASDYGDTGVDFIVLVPNDVDFNEADMRAQVNRYALPSKRYKIVRTDG